MNEKKTIPVYRRIKNLLSSSKRGFVHEFFNEIPITQG